MDKISKTQAIKEQQEWIEKLKKEISISINNERTIEQLYHEDAFGYLDGCIDERNRLSRNTGLLEIDLRVAFEILEEIESGNAVWVDYSL